MTLEQLKLSLAVGNLLLQETEKRKKKGKK